MESEKIAQSEYYNINEISDIFVKLLEDTDYDLDQMAGNNAFTLPKDADEELRNDLEKFLELISAAYKENNDVLAMFDNVEKGEHSDKFITLLRHYLKLMNQPIEETAFLRELTIEEFNVMANYCYSNYINNNDVVQNSEQWKKEQLNVMRKVILSVAELAVLLNYSKQHVLQQAYTMFLLEEKQGEILWNIAKENEDRLWKYLMVLRNDRIDEKLDMLLDLLQNYR